MSYSLGKVRTQKIDFQGKDIGGQPSDNDWRIFVESDNLLFQYYNASHYDPGTGVTGAFITRQQFVAGSVGNVNVTVPETSSYNITGKLNVSDDLYIDTDTLVVDSTSNQVGIGVLNPTAKLDVNGDGKISGDFRVTGDLIVDGSVTQGGTVAWTSRPDDKIYYVKGNVGIGTNNPNELLHVSGGVLIGDTQQTTAGTIRWNGADFECYSGNEWKSLTQETSGASGTWTKDTGTNKITFTNGNVGIGTNNPSVKLQVDGAIMVSSETITTPLEGTMKFDGGDFVGYIGNEWKSLTIGSQGPPGPSGPSEGPPGSEGLVGSTGSAGSDGLQGPPGPAGSQGLQGPTGPPGGAPGESGSSGAKGEVGVQGPPGPAGAKGIQGIAGPPGGPSGPPGEKGSTGSGIAGPPGPTGATGADGPPGSSDGPPGQKGEPGTGTQGPDGPLGPAGPTGAKGDTGDTGPAGAKGDTGGYPAG